MRKSNGPVLIGLGIAVLVVIIIIVSLKKDKPQEIIAKPVEEKAAPAKVEIFEKAPTVETVSEPKQNKVVLTLPDEVIEEPIVEYEDDIEPVNFYNGMDPEDQPRAFDRASFVGLSSIPKGFVITGDAILTKQGWSLKPPATGQEDAPRSGMIESPVYQLEFPSNALSSGWKEVSPPGTEVLIEIAASPDGKNWTDWYPTTGAHMDGEISEYNEVTFEKNPNYGYTLGDMVFFGVGKYQYYKYSMMLYSENPSAPLVSNFYVYLQDSTMGDGYMVEYDESRDMSIGVGN